MKAVRFELQKSKFAAEMRVYAVTSDEEIYLFSIGRYWATVSLIEEIESLVGKWGATTTGDTSF